MIFEMLPFYLLCLTLDGSLCPLATTDSWVPWYL